MTDDVEAIKQVKARYCRTMDTKDWAAMREVFADELVMDTTESGGELWSDADAFIAFMTQNFSDVITVHHCHMPEISLASPVSATAVWAMEDMLRFADGSEMHGFGHYHEVYDKSDGDWKILSSKLTRLRTDFSPTPVVQETQP